MNAARCLRILPSRGHSNAREWVWLWVPTDGSLASESTHSLANLLSFTAGGTPWIFCLVGRHLFNVIKYLLRVRVSLYGEHTTCVSTRWVKSALILVAVLLHHRGAIAEYSGILLGNFRSNHCSPVHR